MRNGLLTLMLSLMTGMASAQSAPALVSPSATESQDRWQAMAKTDLDAAHNIIVEAHPGTIDTENPSFGVLTDTGYREALELLPYVTSYDGVLAVVRYYITGFRDGHMFYSDDTRTGDRLETAGWIVDLVDGQYVVTATESNWPSDLPPKGSILLGCDGRSPDLIIKESVAPYFDRRDTAAVHRFLAPFMTLPMLERDRLQRCKFTGPDASILQFLIHYEFRSFDDVAALLASIPKAHRWNNSFTLNKGLLWIHAANFNLQAGDAKMLDNMLAQLRRLTGVTQIVFDARGNGGGDSGVGERMFEAATGGLAYDRKDLTRLPRTYAQWRVSNESIEAVGANFNKFKALYGAGSPQATDAGQLLAELKAAKLAGRQWVTQSAGYRLTREDFARRHARLRRFSGTVVLITDSTCASACLDFADLVRSVPGSIHVGQTTGADSNYIDIGKFRLPSGNRMTIPLKVWRNRLRGNNEALQPDVSLDVDVDDDGLRAETAAAVDKFLGSRRK